MSGIFLGDKPTKTGAVVNADEIPLLDSQDLSSGRKKVKKVTAANLKSSIGGVQSIQEGAGVSVDNTDPANPVVSASGAVKEFAFRLIEVEDDVVVQEVYNTIGPFSQLFQDGGIVVTFTEIPIPSNLAYPPILQMLDSQALGGDDVFVRIGQLNGGFSIDAFVEGEPSIGSAAGIIFTIKLYP